MWRSSSLPGKIIDLWGGEWLERAGMLRAGNLALAGGPGGFWNESAILNEQTVRLQLNLARL